jgi:hypothetical protein
MVRDPRKDPRPGDVTTYSEPGLTILYRVTRLQGRLVYFFETINGATTEHDTYVEDWIVGSETDEVLHVES